MKAYRFKYGDGHIDVPLEENNIIGVLHGNVYDPLCDIKKALFDSLKNPVG